MDFDSQDEKLIARYLLGDLTEPEGEAFERRYFADSELFRQISAVEDDLVDAYARGQLGGDDLRRFKKEYLSTDAGRRKVALAHAVVRGVDEAAAASVAWGNSASPVDASRAEVSRAEVSRVDASQVDASRADAFDRDALTPRRSMSSSSWLGVLLARPSARYATAAALVLALACGLAAWWRLKSERRAPETETARQENVSATKRDAGGAATSPDSATPPRDTNARDEAANDDAAEARSTQLTQANSSPEKRREHAGAGTHERRPTQGSRGPSPPVASLVLVPGLVRSSGDARTVEIPAGAGELKLDLVFDGSDHRSYRALLRTVEGRKLLSAGGLKARAFETRKSVRVSAPARLFTGTEDYVMMLSGRARGGAYEGVSEYYFRASKAAR